MATVHLLAFVHPDVLPDQGSIDRSRSILEELGCSVELFPLWSKASAIHYVAALTRSACSPQPFGVIGYRSAAFQDRVNELLDSDTFDLIHVDTIELGQFVRGKRKIPAVLTHQNIESVLMGRRAMVESRLLARMFLRREAEKLRRYEAAMTPLFDANILVSRVDEQTIAGLVPGLRTAVVDNGVDVEYFTPHGEADAPAVIYAGSMTMFANRDAMTFFIREIWPRVCAQEPNVQFYVVGKSPPPAISALADRDSRIVVTGYVEDIRPLVRKSSVYVVPLRVGGGTRLKVLDAMAMGKAVVSTSIGCEGLEVRHNENIVVADTPEAFAERTLELLADRPRRIALGCAARQLVEQRYSWQKIGRQLLHVYHNAIHSETSRQ